MFNRMCQFSVPTNLRKIRYNLRQGVSVSKLKENAKKLQEEEKKRFREANEEAIRARKAVAVEPSSVSRPEVAATPRKDSSPVKVSQVVVNRMSQL